MEEESSSFGIVAAESTFSRHNYLAEALIDSTQTSHSDSIFSPGYHDPTTRAIRKRELPPCWEWMTDQEN